MIERMCEKCGRSSAIRPCPTCARLEKRALKDMQKREKMKAQSIKREKSYDKRNQDSGDHQQSAD